MLLSLKDDDDDDEDDDNNEGEDEEEDYEDEDDDVKVERQRLVNDNIDTTVQQTILAFDEQDFFGTRNTNQQLITEPITTFTHNGHYDNTQLTNANLKQQQLTTMTPTKTTTTSSSTSLLNTHDNSSLLTSHVMSNGGDMVGGGGGGAGGGGIGVVSGIDEIIESSSSNNKTSNSQHHHYTNSNSPRSNGNSHTNSPAPRRPQNYSSASQTTAITTQTTAAPRLFSSNILPTHLRQDSYHDDTDEICLVPEVDFECSSIMDHCSDNRESQPLLGGGGGGGGAGGSAGSRDHFDMACNTFVGKLFFYLNKKIKENVIFFFCF